MAICEFGIITRFLQGKKTGHDNFMAVCEFGDESGEGVEDAIKRAVIVIQIYISKSRIYIES